MNSEKVMKVMNAFSKKVISLAVYEYVRCTLFIFLTNRLIITIDIDSYTLFTIQRSTITPKCKSKVYK